MHQRPEYMAALDGAKLAAARTPVITLKLPSETHTEIALVHIAVGAAQLRLGLLREALANFELAEKRQALGSTRVFPAIEFLKAIAHHGLGEVEAASADYERGLAEVRINGFGPLPDLEIIDSVLELEARKLLGHD